MNKDDILHKNKLCAYACASFFFAPVFSTSLGDCKFELFLVNAIEHNRMNRL